MSATLRKVIKLSMSLTVSAALLAGCNAEHLSADKEPKATVSVARGKYLIKTAGCNDCHTPGYLVADGNIDEKQWLTGDVLGWRGPWGTTYGSNLRLFMNSLTEDQWVDAARTLRRRPPMPWFNLNAMAETDLRSIYRFTRSLGEPGLPAPAALAPGEKPNGPYAQLPGPSDQPQARDLVMQFYQQFDRGALPELDALVDSSFSANVMGNQNLDWKGFKNFSAQFKRAFPDGRHEIDRVLVEDDTVITIGHYRGTHEGELMGIAPTHKQLNLAVMHLDRISNGKIVEHLGIANGNDLMKQLNAENAH